MARALAREIAAVHVRIDSIEEAIRASGVTVMSLDDAGYRAAYAVATDNLLLGHIVIADSVNPLPVTRAAWLDVARHAQVRGVEVEVRCSNEAEHRRRVEGRLTVEQTGPTWQDVLGRDYRTWPSANYVLDTAARTPEQAASELRTALGF